MKPLDFVKTPKGNIAIITETNNLGAQASITFIGRQNPDNEKNAWWYSNELEVIDNLPLLLAYSTAHPFGQGRADADRAFGDKK